MHDRLGFNFTGGAVSLVNIVIPNFVIFPKANAVPTVFRGVGVGRVTHAVGLDDLDLGAVAVDDLDDEGIAVTDHSTD